MKKLLKRFLGIVLITLGLFSCTSDDHQVEDNLNRGSIEFEYQDEKLVFGQTSFTGWVLNKEKDTVAYFYKSRIRYGDDFTEFDDFTLFAYLKNKNEIKSFEIEFLPRQSDREGSVYDKQLIENPIVFKNVNFEGKWLKADFEGKLFYNLYDLNDYTEFKNGKINIPLKGLNVPDKY